MWDQIQQNGYKFSNPNYQCFFRALAGQSPNVITEEMTIDCNINGAWVRSSRAICWQDIGKKMKSRSSYDLEKTELAFGNSSDSFRLPTNKEFTAIIHCEPFLKKTVRASPALNGYKNFSIPNGLDCEQTCWKEDQCAGWSYLDSKCELLSYQKK